MGGGGVRGTVLYCTRTDSHCTVVQGLSGMVQIGWEESRTTGDLKTSPVRMRTRPGGSDWNGDGRQ